ncbi:hypothetical protein BJX66DRAFT_112732 [Aspergillus keveii]|uniref:Uncharacterized protein n=1 Tax=Aspergillus keveii TaxID=714993 RepID=A0ABR4GDN5_9EURO
MRRTVIGYCAVSLANGVIDILPRRAEVENIVFRRGTEVLRPHKPRGKIHLRSRWGQRAAHGSRFWLQNCSISEFSHLYQIDVT